MLLIRYNVVASVCMRVELSVLFTDDEVVNLMRIGVPSLCTQTMKLSCFYYGRSNLRRSTAINYDINKAAP
jgi:hypothetical protein